VHELGEIHQPNPVKVEVILVHQRRGLDPAFGFEWNEQSEILLENKSCIVASHPNLKEQNAQLALELYTYEFGRCEMSVCM